MTVDLESKIRDIPDFPKRGIVFKDIMPLLADSEALHETVERLAEFAEPRKPDLVLGAEARGFILGAALAYRLGCGFVAARKPGKLPWRTISAKYALEYGFDALELHADAISDGARVLVHDDLLATGGTAKAKIDLVEQLGGTVVGLAFVIELTFLGGREKLEGYDVCSLVTYAELTDRAEPSSCRYIIGVRCTTSSPGATRFPARHGARSGWLSRASASWSACPGPLIRPSTRSRSRATAASEHDGLVTHDELDWAPLAGSDSAFLNLMTARLESAAHELLDLAARRIQAGAWPWSFFCYPEERPRPVTPSAFRVLAGGGAELGLAVECPCCAQTSVNVVSREHVDVPFYNDRRVGVVEHIFARDRELALSAFRDELDSGAFDARRRDLAA